MERSIKEFNFPKGTDFYFVINEEDKDYVEQLEKILKKFKNNSKIIVTPDTQGQAETAFIGCREIPNEFPIFFFNGDTILRNRNVQDMSHCLTNGYSGIIDTFIENTDHFSFVKLDENHTVTEIAEKIVISNYATTGLYGFSGKSVYTKYYQKLETNKEKYISDIYKIMISSGEKIKATISANKSDTVILGTPQEYFSNKHRL